ncbi:transient receptor potential cation channel subfamily V member 1-like isoform X2 [Ostrea edulis]|uniref:transient receptor potential cation channel subfamily V member 1-like isoform X2 n=1 Tax=Ostrea edulis TaxID=37623 RepID=UPI0024AF65DE|nr:transient receptor potential cation channel subfamily V member 1-like isoform X2 [Ostrea edulis]
MDNNRRKRKGKVAPTGEENSSFELDMHSDIQNNSKFINTLKNKFKETKNKQNAISAIVGAKGFASKWKNYSSTKRVVKSKNAQDDEENAAIKGKGLDQMEDLEAFKPFSMKQDTRKKLRTANDKTLIDYFYQLGQSRNPNAKVDLDFIDSLIKNGANINCTDKHGQTLLHEVCRTWHIDVSKFLLELGSDVNQADKYGRTPLHVAAAVDYPEMVEILIKNGADRESLSNEKQTPVHYAAKNDACNSLKMLIKMKCKYNDVKDFKGRTPLFVAAELDRSETASLLLDYKADVRITDDSGMKPLSWMITKMPPVALDALKQFHSTDRPNRRQYFYLKDLITDREKDRKAKSLTPLQCATHFKQYDLLSHKVMLALINQMWTKFGRIRAWFNLLLNFAYIMIWTVYGLLIEYDVRYKYNLPEQWWRIVLLVAAIGFTIWQIIEEVLEYKRSVQFHNNWVTYRRQQIEEDIKFCHPRWTEESEYLKKELASLDEARPRYWSDFWNVFDWICYVFLITSIATHIVDIFVHSDDLARAHIRIMSVTIIMLWLRLMKVARAFALLGPFIVMLSHMVKDLLRFAFLYLEFYLPFVCAFWMIFGGSKRDYNDYNTLLEVEGYTNFGDVFYSLFRLTLVDEYDWTNMQKVDPIMAKILVGFWLALSAVLCLNLFIALLSDTFQRVYDNAQANAVMQKALMTLSIWENMSESRRNIFNIHMETSCNPWNEYYDDDMTEEGEEDMKKVTMQIKDDLDDLRDVFDSKFGKRKEEEEEEDLNNKSRMVDVERFENEIGILRDSLTELRVRQDDMMDNLQKGMNNITNLLNEMMGHPQGSRDVDIVSESTQQRSARSRSKKSKKRKDSQQIIHEEETSLLEPETPSPPSYQQLLQTPPTVDVSMADFSPREITQTSQPSFSPRGPQDGQDPSTEC